MDHAHSDFRSGPEVAIPTLKSLFIEMLFGETLLASGTAFLIANDQSSHCALITNRHNVTGRHQETGECLDKKHGAVPDAIKIYFHKDGASIGEWHPVRLPLFRPDGSKFWIEHPTLGDAADVVALNLNWGSDVLRLPYYLKTPEDSPGILVGPADPVSVIGFPFGLSSSGRFPLWATGYLAQELSLVSTERPTFFIDCRTRQGQSGSPVIAYRPEGSRKRFGGKMVATMSPVAEWEFLGIYCGRANHESDLGVVWHRSALVELIAQAEAQMPNRTAPLPGEVANADTDTPSGASSIVRSDDQGEPSSMT